MDEHIFDILGIGSREDSYTDLIAIAFGQSANFRKNFLALLQELDGRWNYLVRPPVVISSDTGRQKDVPDLVLFSREQNRVLLIENKIFSGEGWDQTKRYSSKDFRRSLEAELGMVKPEFKFFFLTLEEAAPASPEFLTLSYLDILNAIPIDLGSSKLDILLDELRKRISEYYNWPAPKYNEKALGYLRSTKRLVSSFRAFQLLAESSISESDFIKECGTTANRGSGFIPYCSFYKKAWCGKEYAKHVSGHECYYVHFELQWDTREDWERLSLYLHYETNPYMTRTELNKQEANFVKEYLATREGFASFIKAQAPKEWNICNYYLKIAEYVFEREISAGDLKELINKLTNNMSVRIAEYMEEKRNL